MIDADGSAALEPTGEQGSAQDLTDLPCPGTPDTSLPDTVTESLVAPEAVVSPGAARRRLNIAVVIAAVVVVVDQLTKAWALSSLTESTTRKVVGDLLGFRLVHNPGAALSIATGMTWVLTVVAVAVIVVVLRASQRLASTRWAVALGLLLGGAIGNLIDRLVRDPGFAKGHVVDFIAYSDWFVGNVADIAIVAAAALIILLSLLQVSMSAPRD